MTVVLNFDASTVEPQVPFEAVPADDYTMMLVKATAEQTKAKDGGYLRCDFVITEGQYKGRHIFDNLNLWNKSTQASEIAWRQMSGLCHAVGVLQVATVDQLYNIPFTGKVGIEEDEQYGRQNRIKGFSKPTAAAAPAWTAPAQPQANPTPAPAQDIPFNTQPGGDTVQPPWMTAAPAAPAEPAATTAAPPWATQTSPPAASASAPPWAK